MIFFSKNKKKLDEKDFVNAKTFENQTDFLLKKSERRAWTISFICIGITSASLFGIFSILPLKETIPYVIKSNSSGYPEVINAINPDTLKADEAMNKFFVAQYILNRESYTYQTITKTYLDTQLYNNSSVNKIYISDMAKQPTIDKIMKDGTIEVVIKSIVLDNSAGDNVATVRFDKIYHYTDKDIPEKKPFIARLSFEYKPSIKMKLEYRIQNPLGFKVTSYQIVPEVN